MKRGIRDERFLANFFATLPEKESTVPEQEAMRNIRYLTTKLTYLDNTEVVQGRYQRETNFLTKAMRDVDRRQIKYDPTTCSSSHFTVTLKNGNNEKGLDAGLQWLLGSYDALIGPEHIKVVAVGLEYAAQVKRTPIDYKRANAVCKIVLVRFRRALTIQMDFNEDRLPDYAVQALTTALTGYELVGVTAALTIWRLWGIGIGCDMLDVTGFSKPYPETALPRRLAKELENNAPESIRAVLGSLTYFYSFDGSDIHAPAAAEQPTLLLPWQGLVYYLLCFRPKPCHFSPVYSSMGLAEFDPDSEDNARLSLKFPMPRMTPISTTYDLDERHQTLLNMAFAETALAQSRDDIIRVEFAEPTIALWETRRPTRDDELVELADAIQELADQGHELEQTSQGDTVGANGGNDIDEPRAQEDEHPDVASCIKFRCRNLKTMPMRSERQAIRLEIKWRRRAGVDEWNYSTIFGRVIATRETYVYICFDNDGSDPAYFHDYFKAPPIDGKDVIVFEISTVGPSDPTAEDTARYHFMHLVSASIPNLIDPTGLLKAVYPQLCVEDDNSISARLCEHLIKHKMLHQHVSKNLPQDALVDDSQKKVIDTILTPLDTASLSSLGLHELFRQVIRFVQGPPGTGKSSTIAYAVNQLIAHLQVQAESGSLEQEAEKQRLNQQGRDVRDNKSGVTKEQHDEQVAAFNAKWSSVNQSEAVFIINKNNLTTINTHNALEKIDAAHSVLRPAVFGAFHETTYKAMEETAIDLRGLKGALGEGSVERIILCTVGTFQSLPSWFFAARKPTIVIVEEASTLPINFLPSIFYTCGHYHLARLVFAGDQNQLGPFMSELLPTIKSCFALNVAPLSTNNKRGKKPFEEVMLKTAYRNPFGITNALSAARYRGSVLPAQVKVDEAHQPFCRFIDVSGLFGKLDDDHEMDAAASQHLVNDHDGVNTEREVTSAVPVTAPSSASDIILACDLLEHYLMLGRSTTVLTMYEQHRFAISTELYTRGVNLEASSSDKLSTVDGFQGREDDYIILVIGRSGSSTGFVGSRERQTVAISRARVHLTIVTHYRFITETLRGELLDCLSNAEGAEWVTADDKFKDLQFCKHDDEATPVSADQDAQMDSGESQSPAPVVIADPSSWD